MLSDLANFSVVLRSGGPAAALGYLNAGVAHRYTAVYRFETDRLVNVLLYDKRGEPTPDYLAVIPFEESFCQFVLRDKLFRTNDSAADLRLDGHPNRGLVLSYHSVPLLEPTGKVWGTLSHFDMEPMTLAEDQFALMQAVAGLLPKVLIRA